MARPVERRVRQVQQVDTNLPKGGIQRAAQTTRALGTTRIGGRVANNSHALAGLRGLSRGLDDAFKTTMGLAAKDKQGDVVEGRMAQVSGEESFDDQKTRGQQEGFLESQGRAAGLGVSGDLHSLYERGAIERPGEPNNPFVWNKVSGETIGQASQRYLQERLSGLGDNTENTYFLRGMYGIVDNTMQNLQSQNIKEANMDFALERGNILTTSATTVATSLYEYHQSIRSRPFAYSRCFYR